MTPDTEATALRAENERLRRIEAVALKIRTARDQRWARTRKAQELAAEARRTGQSMSHRSHEIDRIEVWDLGDLVDELCRALTRDPSCP